MLTLDKIYHAAFVLKDVARKTDLIEAPKLSKDCQLYLKTENLQVTGSFKVRGAYYKISQLSKEESDKGVIACSAGNHAQGVALAATRRGIRSIVCMPDGAPIMKVENTKNLGAEVCLVPGTYDDAHDKAVELQEETGMTFIHPYDDEQVIAGQGTIGLEILDQLPDVDAVIVPVGGGGLCTGVSTLAKLLNPKVKVIAVEPAGAACLKASLEAGKVVSVPAINTIADGTAVQTPGDKLFPYLQANVDEVITIEDSELTLSFLDMAENHKMIVENSGLLTVAALKHLDFKGKKVVSVLSGGNMDVLTMATVVQNGLILRDRIFTVSVMLPDKPGQLADVSALIAKLQGNVIKLDHNVFANVNRSAGVLLTITMETFGTEHKKQIIQALEDAGYAPAVERTSGIYM